MAENKKRYDPRNDKIKFNSYWVYGITIFVVLGLNIYIHYQSQTEITTMRGFIKMVQAEDVQNLKVINKSKGEVILKQESFYKYMDLDETKYFALQPHYTFEIGDIRTFEEKIDALNEAGQNIDHIYVTETNWIGPVLNWMLLLLLIIGPWLFIKRLVSSRAGAGAQIFNIGKSNATLIDSNARVNVKFKHKSGLDEANEEDKKTTLMSTQNHIEDLIKAFLKNEEISHLDLYDNLYDHLYLEIENQLENNIKIEIAFEKAIKIVCPDGAATIQRDLIHLSLLKYDTMLHKTVFALGGLGGLIILLSIAGYVGVLLDFDFARKLIMIGFLIVVVSVYPYILFKWYQKTKVQLVN